MTERFLLDPASVLLPAHGEWSATLPLGARPLHVEIGFGKDIRVLRAAREHPEAWFLGIEISRKKCVSFSKKVARLGLENVRCVNGDVRDILMEKLEPGCVASFTILFPDPWPKRRQQKHRWIQPATAALLARALAPGGTIIVATDHPGYAEQIRECMRGAGLECTKDVSGVPDEDRTLFAERFERMGREISHQTWRKG